MHHHFLQLYDDVELMLDRVVAFMRGGAEADAALVVIATPDHRAALASKLADCADRMVTRDARSLLDDITRGDRIDESLFKRHVGGLFASAAPRGKGTVRGFGEMVALLWQDGNHGEAVRLERLWSALAGSDRHSLMCAYPLSAASDIQGEPFLAICDGHSHVFASEHAAHPNLPRRIAALEKEALALRSELARRMDIQHKMSQSDQDRDQFISVLAHELRNPLSPIVTAVEMLKKPMHADQQQRLIATIGRQTSVLARLVDDLFDTRQIAAGQASLATAPVALCSIIEQACEAIRPKLQGHQLVVDCDADCTLTADSVRLVQAVTNLLSNAAKFTPAGGSINLTARQVDDVVRIEVRDNGRGMQPEFLAHAFEPYMQAARGEGGLGLGLSIVRSIIQMHGGTIQAASPGLDLGTTFIIEMPTVRHPVKSAGSRVLVVDDDDDVRATLATLMQSYGHEARTASSGKEALDEMKHRPHVVLLDIGMPGMDGVEVARQIRLEGEPPLLVALSGSVVDEPAMPGFDHQFTKPPDVDKLLEVVASSLHRKVHGRSMAGSQRPADDR